MLWKVSCTARCGIKDSDGWSKLEDNFCRAFLAKFIQLDQSLCPTIAIAAASYMTSIYRSFQDTPLTDHGLRYLYVLRLIAISSLYMDATPYPLCFFHLYLAAVVQVIASSRASQGSCE